MVAVRFPTSTAPGARPAEGGGRLINAFAEPLSGGGPGDFVIRRSPGLQAVLETVSGAARGAFEVDGGLFVIVDDRCYYALDNQDSTFTVNDIGEVLGEGRVSFARNVKRPVPDVLCVTTAAVYRLTSSSVSELSDPDLPQPNGVAFIGGYFVFSIADGRLFATALNDVTVDPLDFTTANARPDPLLVVKEIRGELFAFGRNSVEVYYNSGNAEGFPLSPRNGLISNGLIGANAIAGGVPGFVDDVCWVDDTGTVVRLQGYQTARISTSDLERLIADVSDKNALVANVYVCAGHPVWVLSSPEWTWEYNLNTGFWNERKSLGRRRWRATETVFAFGRWLALDEATGTLYAISDGAFREGSNELPMEVWSTQAPAFPGRAAIPAASFAFVVGQGRAPGADPIEASPRASISWSDDGGVTWSSPLLRELGPQGAYRQQVKLHRTGLTGVQGRMWKIVVSDPVYVSILGGEMAVLPRSA